MLQRIRIKNFAVIDNLVIDFEPGLNIISGETGAGKSVIITALELVLGARGSSEFIRTGAEQMIVEASFSLGNSEIRNKLENCGIDLDSEGILTLKRRLSRQGKSACFANDSLINLATLMDLGQELVDIHGQHQHQLLLRPETHLDFLDSFAGLLKSRQHLEKLFNNWQNVQKKCMQLQAQKHQQAMKKELLEFQVQEIDQADLREGEEESLKTERTLLLNAEKILENGQWVYQTLYAAEGAVSEMLAQAKTNIRELSRFDEKLSPLLETAESLGYQVEELAFSINKYLDNIEYNLERHQEIENRLSLIEGLKRKYGQSVGEVIKFRQKIKSELENVFNIDQKLENLEKQGQKLEAELNQIAAGLSENRHAASRHIESLMEKELKQVGILQADFRVSFKPVKETEKGYKGNAQGLEEVEFLFSANPGEQPKALAKVASGGELSRIMLVLKGLLSGGDRVGSLVFDEVDVGIGGKIAEVVGKKLKKTAEFQQVVCITHLPQIAALAGHHYKVDKKVEQEKTFTSITKLDAAARIEEIARMLAGAEITPAALNHAQMMIHKNH